MPREAIACGATHEVVAVRDMATRVVDRLIGGPRSVRAAS
jgi:chemotaxis response regulator CheB